MSEFRINVVRIGEIVPHMNADRLEITRVFDYPVIIAKGEFRSGDLAVYIPVDSVVPENDTRWAFLGDHRRIKARKLRGVFSMGLLTKADPAWQEGQDVREILQITKYEPIETFSTGGENEACPFEFPVYTDIEGFRRWLNLLVEGEHVSISEKIHGANGRFLYKDGRLWIGSHKQVKRRDPNNLWWKMALHYDLENKLKNYPDIVFFGEVFGCVQDLKYGHSNGKTSLAFFDAMYLNNRQYLSMDEFKTLADLLGLILVPSLYEGSWSKELLGLAEGKSLFGDHVREGIVIRPVQERWDEKIGRVILKYLGEGYLLR